MSIMSIYDTLIVPLTFARKRRNRKFVHLRRAGDRARDTKNWSEAIQFYERYLALLPLEGPTWVQLGHVRKESGQLDGAETAYLTAQALMPRDADLLLQLGHLFKLQGRKDDAVESYAASLKLAPGADAYSELIELNEIALANDTIDTSETRLSSAIYFQVSDLLSYLEHHSTVSGIQRVQLGIIEHIIDLKSTDALTCRFVYSGSRGSRLFLVNTEVLKAIATCLSNIRVDGGHLRQLVMRARSATKSISIGKGDTFVVLGSYWGRGGSAELLRSLQARGVKTGIYFYDIIPCTHPEFCEDLLTAEFTQALIEAVNFIDFGLAISDFTRDEVARFLQKAGIPLIPLYTVQLAHSIVIQQVKFPAQEDVWPESIAEFKGQRFVVCVSTIEVRKNHRYLLDVWKALLEEGVDVPLLLFIGRQGWRVDDLMSQLKATAYLNGRIRILHNLSDGELSFLYRNCFFTTFPSLVEGWGLPIGESLSFGKLCVASNTSAMPEVGGALVEYVDPLNTRAAIETFRRLIGNPSEVAAWEVRIQATFQQRGWSTVARHFLETLSRAIVNLPEIAGGVFVPMLKSGVVVQAGIKAEAPELREVDFKQRQLNLIFQEYWSRPTDRGMQMAGLEGKIIFKTDSENREVIILLCLSIGRKFSHYNIVASVNDAAPIQARLPGGSKPTIRLLGHTDHNGCVRIRLRTERYGIAEKNRSDNATVIVRSVGYTVADDTSHLTKLLEAVLQINDGAALIEVAPSFAPGDRLFPLDRETRRLAR